MTRRKERPLRELYGVTGRIKEPEITPVLRGCCRIQGPIDETDRESLKNTGLYCGEIRSGGHNLGGKVCMGTESGTCNVCSAPCSSCMHLNRSVSRMDLKAEDEFSDETSRVKAASRCSFNATDVPPNSKHRGWGDRRCAASETSNIASVSSSHDSFSENAESKVTVRTFDTSDASEDVETVPRVLIGQSPSKPDIATISSTYVVSDVGNRTFSDRFEEQRGLECHDDNISCVSGTNDANMPVADLSVAVDRKNISSSSASVSSVFRRRFGKEVNLNSVPDCAVDIKCEVEEKFGNFRKPSVTTEEVKQEEDPTIGSATVGSLTNAGLQEVPSSKDLFVGNGSLEVRSPLSRSKSRKSPFVDSAAKDLEDNSCSHHQAAPALSSEHAESSGVKLEQCHGVALERPTANSCDEILPTHGNSKASLMSTSGASTKIYPCIEGGVSKDSGFSNNGSMKCYDLNEQVQKPDKSPEVPSAPEPSLHSQSVDESDDSEDIVEDVKVCDICGDAGREDLLAVCSKCGDGAEHTYCMRIKMDKVPEGYWLCEECKFKEEAENKKQDKLDVVAGASKAPCVNERKLNSETALSPKRVSKISDVDTNRAPKVGSSSQFPPKRHLDSFEGMQAAKRQAVEASSGSPRPCSPSKKTALSRENSFKNLDKGKVKPVHQTNSSGGLVAYNSRENSNSPTTSSPTSLRYQPRPLPRGTLLKSKSFNSFSKPKVKTMQEEFRKKPKSSRDTAKTETKKEGFGKSQSFRSARPSSTLSKDTVRSTHFSGNEDLRPLKQAKDRNGIERTNSFRTDRSLVKSPKPGGSSGFSLKNDHKAPRGDLKSVQPDGKQSKSSSLLANRGLDIPKPLAGFGDPKRQSSFLSRGIASPLSRMTSSTEQNPSHVSPKDESMRRSVRTSERPGNCDAVLQDSSGQSQEPVSHSRLSISAGDSCIRCQKCKEIGHDVQSCSLGISRASVVEPSAVGSLREVMSKSNKPRGAVESSSLKTAVQKSIRLPDQSDESDLSCELAKNNPSPSSSCLMGLTTAETTRDGREGFMSSADSSKSKTAWNVKQNNIHPIEASCSSRAGALDPHILSNGNFKPCALDSLSLASTAIGPVSSLPIPEYEYRWQGGFKVQRSGRSMDIYDGIQAHLSTCASPKVHEAVVTFPYHVFLEEVPRLSTWPVQFQNYATEDNIALYFFAKDFESYEKSYKSLLDNLIKNDLALKGNLNGVELLIFPSNQLPEKSQRWNMLYFLWGVFRVKRLNCTEHGSQTKPCGTDLNALPTPTLAVSEKESSHGNVKESSACNISLNEKETLKSTCSRPLDEQEAIRSTISMEVPIPSSSGRVDSKSCEEIVCLEHDAVCLQSNASPLGSVLVTNLSSSTSTIHPLAHGELKGYHTSKDALTHLGSNEVELQPHYALTRNNSGLSNNGSKVQLNLDKVHCMESALPSTSSDSKDRLYGSCKGVFPVSSPSLAQEAGAVDRRLENSIQERSSGNAVILLEAIKDEDITTGSMTYLDGDLVTKEYGNMVLNSSRKRSSSETFTSSSQSMAWKGKLDSVMENDEKESKRMKTCYSEMCGSSSTSGKDQNSSGGRFPKQMYNLNSPPVEEPSLDMAGPENSNTAERHFFPMDLDPVKDWRVRGGSVPLHVLSSDDEDQPVSTVPSLELALGAERRSAKQQGMLPLFVALDKKIDQGKLPGKTVKEEKHDEDALASLSLSLSFSLPEKERSAESVPKPPGGPPVDTKLFLYGGFSDT